MWWCWHEMLAINIKRGMSTHVAEGKLHCPPPEFPSQVEGSISRPTSCTEWRECKGEVAMEEVYARTTYKQK